MNQNNSLAIILAAGKGTRMNETVPKPLVPVYQKPIISWIIESFQKNNVDIAIIINPEFEFFFDSYTKAAQFVYQEKQLGTGHAVLQASELIKNYDHVFVFVGDSPFVDQKLISEMYLQHTTNNNDATILTSVFDGRKFPYARIIRNNKGNINKVIEEIDASQIERASNELFGSHYLFNSEILYNYLSRLVKNPKTGEVYFTDILNELIIDDKKLDSLIVHDWRKLVGLNTREDIDWAEYQKMI